MAGYNRIIVIGNLTRDPELRELAQGQVCRLGLASNRQYKNKQSGAPVKEVCFIDVDVWGAQALSCKQYLQKGRPVLVEGRLRFEQWKTAEGQDRSRHVIVAERVVFLGSNADAEIGDEYGGAGASTGGMSMGSASSGAGLSLDGFKDEAPFADELPF